VKFVSRINCLINEYLDLPEVQRLKELEPYIDNNKELEKKLAMMEELKQKMKEARENENYQLSRMYKASYYMVYDEILDMPFVEEFRELMDIVFNKLDTTATIIEKELQNRLK
jgi:cell fate (sporulation/competence/biofilm development) regulator YmcA (YheA/YmcA/DUF963 family)